jgi:hypothetical protein
MIVLRWYLAVGKWSGPNVSIRIESGKYSQGKAPGLKTLLFVARIRCPLEGILDNSWPRWKVKTIHDGLDNRQVFWEDNRIVHLIVHLGSATESLSVLG